MAKSNYLDASDDGFAHQLTTFKNAIGAYATTLGVSAAQVTSQADDALYFNYVLAVQELMANSAKQWTAWKTLQRMGGSIPPTGAPVEPTFPAAVPVVAPGIEPRFRALVKQIKANTDYNASIGAALRHRRVRAARARLLHLRTRPRPLDQRRPRRCRLGLARLQRVPRPMRTPGRSRRWQRHGVTRDRHDAELHRHRTVPERAREVDLPGHLPRRRPARRPMERAGECDGRWLTSADLVATALRRRAVSAGEEHPPALAS